MSTSAVNHALERRTEKAGIRQSTARRSHLSKRPPSAWAFAASVYSDFRSVNREGIPFCRNLRTYASAAAMNASPSCTGSGTTSMPVSLSESRCAGGSVPRAADVDEPVRSEQEAVNHSKHFWIRCRAATDLEVKWDAECG